MPKHKLLNQNRVNISLVLPNTAKILLNVLVNLKNPKIAPYLEEFWEIVAGEMAKVNNFLTSVL